jgi:hypothetical protein
MFDGLRLEVVVCFVDIGRIVVYHCLNFLFYDNCRYPQSIKHKKESLNSDRQQFYQYQQNKQLPLTSNHQT